MYSSIVLAGLAAVLQIGGGPADPQPPKGTVSPEHAVTPVIMDERVRKLYDAMATKISLDYDKKTLPEVVRDLREQTKLNFRVDTKSLEEAGIDLELPVTLHVKDLSLKSVLNLILRKHELTWLYSDDVVVITSVSNAYTVLEARVFGIADLVSPRFVAAIADSNDVIVLITSIIAPTTWSEVGGAGAIKYEPTTKSLVIAQTRDVLDEVAQLLTTLRESRRLQQQDAGKTMPGDDDLTVVLYRLPTGLQEYRSFATAVLSAPLKPGEARDYGTLMKVLKESLDAAKKLAEVIPQVIEPGSWQTKDGKAGGKIFVVDDTLVIHQNARVHAEIAEFLRPSRAGSQAGNPAPGQNPTQGVSGHGVGQF
ncbi:MAG TPA: hypothetical protein VHV55_26830 [Pirellulales bacterium]|jgi:hypothetical protein|nr:hypothetical protein [Pirellulales bacterium]